MTDDQRLKILNDAGGFNAQNGIVLTAWDDGFGAVRVDLAGYHVNPMQIVHGGLYTSMLDVALAMADYADRMTKTGVPLHSITRHMLGVICWPIWCQILAAAAG